MFAMQVSNTNLIYPQPLPSTQHLGFNFRTCPLGSKGLSSSELQERFHWLRWRRWKFI